MHTLLILCQLHSINFFSGVRSTKTIFCLTHITAVERLTWQSPRWQSQTAWSQCRCPGPRHPPSSSVRSATWPGSLLDSWLLLLPLSSSLCLSSLFSVSIPHPVSSFSSGSVCSLSDLLSLSLSEWLQLVLVSLLCSQCRLFVCTLQPQSSSVGSWMWFDSDDLCDQFPSVSTENTYETIVIQFPPSSYMAREESKVLYTQYTPVQVSWDLGIGWK